MYYELLIQRYNKFGKWLCIVLNCTWLSFKLMCCGSKRCAPSAPFSTSPGGTPFLSAIQILCKIAVATIVVFLITG